MDYKKLSETINAAKSTADLYKVIVNAPFEYKVETAFLFLGIIVLLIVDPETAMINRVALSNTELAENTTTVSAKPFHDIKIPLDYNKNIIARAIRTGKHQETSDWEDLFAPALSAEEARLNQASGGIAYSAVYPLRGLKNGGAIIFSHYQYLHEIGEGQHQFMKAYTELVDDILARRHL